MKIAKRLSTRWVICVALCVIALLLIASVTWWSQEVKPSEVISGLATEALGIVATVGVVDYLLERKRLRESARTLAWAVLHELDHAIWVWQGGSRRFDAAELVGLTAMINDSDPRPDFTENLLLRLGSNAQVIAEASQGVVAGNVFLRDGLRKLSELCHIRDTNPPMSNGGIREIVLTATDLLLESVETHAVRPRHDYLLAARDSSERRQAYRHFGEHDAT